MPGRKSYAGAAAGTTLASACSPSELTLSVASAANWPTGVGTQPFVIVLDRGGNEEEKVLIDSRVGLTLNVNVAGRGYDGTSATTHTLGTTAEHCLDADTITEVNAHVNDDARDDHSQYHTTARHAAVSHLIGSHLPAPTTPSSVSVNATGSSTAAARADHTHAMGAGAITNSNQFAAGVVDAAAIGPDAVGTSELQDNAVDTAAIQALAVTYPKLAAAAIAQIQTDMNVLWNQDFTKNFLLMGG